MNFIKTSLTTLSTCVLLMCSTGFASNAPRWQRLHLGRDANVQYDFPVYANRDLSQGLPSIKEVIIIQHGIQRNGDDYYTSAMKLLKDSGRNPDEILIIAPNFPGGRTRRKVLATCRFGQSKAGLAVKMPSAHHRLPIERLRLPKAHRG